MEAQRMTFADLGRSLDGCADSDVPTDRPTDRPRAAGGGSQARMRHRDAHVPRSPAAAGLHPSARSSASRARKGPGDGRFRRQLPPAARAGMTDLYQFMQQKVRLGEHRQPVPLRRRPGPSCATAGSIRSAGNSRRTGSPPSATPRPGGWRNCRNSSAPAAIYRDARSPTPRPHRAPAPRAFRAAAVNGQRRHGLRDRRGRGVGARPVGLPRSRSIALPVLIHPPASAPDAIADHCPADAGRRAPLPTVCRFRAGGGLGG